MPLHTNHEPARVSSTASHLAGRSVDAPPSALLPAFSIHIAKERTRAIFPAHCSSLASRAASGFIKNLNLFLAGQLRRKARTANNTTGREQSRDLSTSYAPVVSGMVRACLENQNPIHAAPAIHGASQ